MSTELKQDLKAIVTLAGYGAGYLAAMLGAALVAIGALTAIAFLLSL